MPHRPIRKAKAVERSSSLTGLEQIYESKTNIEKPEAQTERAKPRSVQRLVSRTRKTLEVHRENEPRTLQNASERTGGRMERGRNRSYMLRLLRQPIGKGNIG